MERRTSDQNPLSSFEKYKAERRRRVEKHESLPVIARWFIQRSNPRTREDARTVHALEGPKQPFIIPEDETTRLLRWAG